MGELVISGARALASTLPRLAASAAGQWAYQSLMTADMEGPRHGELMLQTSSDGASMARLWGRARIAGQVIWAARFREHAETSGGKGGAPRQTDYRYSVSFAVGLCEGEIDGIGRVWANGAQLSLEAYDCRLYKGGEAQMPDPLIAVIEGDDAPAFRGTAYVVFEDMPLDEFGGRIPNLAFEVFRGPDHPGALERAVRGVNLIPGSGEFTLHPDLVMQTLGPGRERSENRHAGRAMSDLAASIEDLERDLPSCRSIQLVVSWFGDDLRCGECRIRPGVEGRDKQTDPVSWSVAGQTREKAYLVSQIDGRPAYGGTPSDNSVIAAIRYLKARGFRVILYPFILMDIPPDNDLPALSGPGAQPAFPWRGRIAVGEGEDAEAIDSAVARFFGGPDSWGLRRHILHYAALAQEAGGVDGFLIGTELAALTPLEGTGGHPAVDALISLAEDVRTLLGPDCRISYAADWTEYSGYQDGRGGKCFHLDPLWSHPDIDAVAIDWYPPMSDWRDGETHLDRAAFDHIDDPDHLAANIRGAEDYDWYYASEVDRASQTRTPIQDAAHGEPWIWRRKDLVNWWSKPHFDRPDGVRATVPTGWQPGMKPIWLTEIGCPAIDKGSNQPNLFFDPKSAESARPFASDGQRDDMIQRRMLEALLGHFEPAGPNNPVSATYGGPMVEPDWIHVWCWDGRPWPDFPARSDIWADGLNWTYGHWLNGRAGQFPLRSLIEAVSADCGNDDIEASKVHEVITGYVQTGPQRGRDVLGPLLRLFGVEATETVTGLRYFSADSPGPSRTLDNPVQPEGGAAQVREFSDPVLEQAQIRLSYIDETADYAPGVAQSSATGAGMRTFGLALVSDPVRAERSAEQFGARLMRDGHSLSLNLPPSELALEAGDQVRYGNENYLIRMSDGVDQRRIDLVRPLPGERLRSGGEPVPGRAQPTAPRPELALLELQEDALSLAVSAAPWIGAMPVLAKNATGGFAVASQAVRPATLGYLSSPLRASGAGRWLDIAFEIELISGQLQSHENLEVFAGANRLALDLGGGEWAIIQFAQAELVGERRYRLSRLLIGLKGSPEGLDLPAGTQAVLIDASLVDLPLNDDVIGQPLNIEAGRQRRAYRQFTPRQRALRPFAPVHLRMQRLAHGLGASWIRRTRVSGDGWWGEDVPIGEASERYRVELYLDAERIWAGQVDQPAAIMTGVTVPPGGRVRLRVCQLSERFGAGVWAQLEACV